MRLFSKVKTLACRSGACKHTANRSGVWDGVGKLEAGKNLNYRAEGERWDRTRTRKSKTAIG